jgi:hypothetical protein
MCGKRKSGWKLAATLAVRGGDGQRELVTDAAAKCRRDRLVSAKRRQVPMSLYEASEATNRYPLKLDDMLWTISAAFGAFS